MAEEWHGGSGFYMLLTDLLQDLFYDPEDRCNMLFQNIGGLLTYHMTQI